MSGDPKSPLTRDRTLVIKELEPGDTAIDAGAHIGFFTMLMAASVGAAAWSTHSNPSMPTPIVLLPM